MRNIAGIAVLALYGCSLSVSAPPSGSSPAANYGRYVAPPPLDIEGEVTWLWLRNDRTNKYRIGVRLTNTTGRSLEPPVCTFSPNSDQIAPLEWADESALAPGVTVKRFATARFRHNVREVSGCYFDCEGRAGME